MTQRIFDIENEQDMQDLWNILPIGIIRIKKNKNENTFWSELFYQDIPSGFIQINWHDKTEITRPIQEATEQDIGKLCYFWGEDEDSSKDYTIGLLAHIDIKDIKNTYHLRYGCWWKHARRLTKQEIEELC